jgi:Fe-S-cluster-containing hydrogenase component 2
METVFVNPDRCIGRLKCERAYVVQHPESKDNGFALLETPASRKRVHAQARAGRIAAVSAEHMANEAFWPVGIAINVMRHEFRHQLLVPSRP